MMAESSLAESTETTVKDFFVLGVDFVAFGADLTAHTGFVAEAVVLVSAIVVVAARAAGDGLLCKRFCIMKPPFDTVTGYGG